MEKVKETIKRLLALANDADEHENKKRTFELKILKVAEKHQEGLIWRCTNISAVLQYMQIITYGQGFMRKYG